MSSRSVIDVQIHGANDAALPRTASCSVVMDVRRYSVRIADPSDSVPNAVVPIVTNVHRSGYVPNVWILSARNVDPFRSAPNVVPLSARNVVETVVNIDYKKTRGEGERILLLLLLLLLLLCSSFPAGTHTSFQKGGRKMFGGSFNSFTGKKSTLPTFFLSHGAFRMRNDFGPEG